MFTYRTTAICSSKSWRGRGRGALAMCTCQAAQRRWARQQQPFSPCSQQAGASRVANRVVSHLEGTLTSHLVKDTAVRRA